MSSQRQHGHRRKAREYGRKHKPGNSTQALSPPTEQGGHEQRWRHNQEARSWGVQNTALTEAAKGDTLVSDKGDGLAATLANHTAESSTPKLMQSGVAEVLAQARGVA